MEVVMDKVPFKGQSMPLFHPSQRQWRHFRRALMQKVLLTCQLAGWVLLTQSPMHVKQTLVSFNICEFIFIINLHYHRKTQEFIVSNRTKLRSSLNYGLLTAGVHSQDSLNGRIGHWVPSRVRDQGDEVAERFD